jgi:hypothetical protein
MILYQPRKILLKNFHYKASPIMVSQQLSLFDTATAVKRTYEIGDLVKLRKKPMAASYVKKGDFVVIDAIHPVDGSVRFWNERSERWEFIQQDEISSIIPKAQIGVTESTPEPADSVTSSAEVGVTESTPEPADSVTSSVSTYRPRGTARSIENCPLKYFRFSYRDGSKVRHVHIRGGNTDSPIAQAKVAEVRSQLAAGIPPAEIAKMLASRSV